VGGLSVFFGASLDKDSWAPALFCLCLDRNCRAVLDNQHRRGLERAFCPAIVPQRAARPPGRLGGAPGTASDSRDVAFFLMLCVDYNWVGFGATAKKGNGCLCKACSCPENQHFSISATFQYFISISAPFQQQMAQSTDIPSRTVWQSFRQKAGQESSSTADGCLNRLLAPFVR
jgi:hypothetical protein